ncbi:hypothetical protein C8Q80DRAFT_1264361 [Daedaleopsis nitida]|nr:hypothetical protein C8Q80DRAFT_1264361 [Daedaleopsis nitida]
MSGNRVARYADLWFEDGNVVVVAQQPETAFRVHRGVLSRHSATFSDLFALPQPPAIQTRSLSPSYWDADEPPKPSVLAAFARLGHKYELLQVFASAMKRLRRLYPNNFDKWFEVTCVGKPESNTLNPIEMFNLLLSFRRALRSSQRDV